MFVRAGSYQHADSEVAVVITRDPIVDGAGVQYAYIERWTLDGFLLSDTQAALTSSLAALERAYNAPLSEMSLWIDAGTPTHHRLFTGNTLGGIRPVGGVEYPEGTGAEYSYYRSFRVVVEAEVPQAFGDRTLQFRESLEITGGGPRRVLIETRAGPPQPQTVSQQTAFRATQTGEAVGWFSYPPVPAPVWPLSFFAEPPRVTRGQPRKVGQGGTAQYVEWPVQWQYTFASATRGGNVPTIVW